MGSTAAMFRKRANKENACAPLRRRTRADLISAAQHKQKRRAKRRASTQQRAAALTVQTAKPHRRETPAPCRVAVRLMLTNRADARASICAPRARCRALRAFSRNVPRDA